MAVILGIDIGTSSIKAMMLDSDQGSIAVRAKEYRVDIVKPDYAEQNPEMWWRSLTEVLHELKMAYPKEYEAISAVGYSGQMHGLVLVDQNGTPVRPAILWLDQRAKEQLREIEGKMTEEEMGTVFCNRVSAGFAFPSLLWVKEREPQVFAKASYLLSVKDYIRFKMTAEIGAEAVDASSMTLFDTGKRDWAWDVIERFGLPRYLFPKAAESSDIAGAISRQCSVETGLREGVLVIYGMGDHMAQSIGNGVIHAGTLISNIGTGGQISAFSENLVYDKKLRTNTFCHAVKHAYAIFGATLCSGMSLTWIRKNLLHMEDYNEVNLAAEKAASGSDGLIYLPYLSGERTPHMNPGAKGMFFGMTLAHDRRHFLRAVMEGVVFSLKDCLKVLQEQGVDAQIVIASGGGAASDVWLQIQADILQKPVQACAVREQACLGSCILAGVGTGIFKSIEEGCEKFVVMKDKIYIPAPENKVIYEENYRIFNELYEKTKELM